MNGGRRAVRARCRRRPDGVRLRGGAEDRRRRGDHGESARRGRRPAGVRGQAGPRPRPHRDRRQRLPHCPSSPAYFSLPGEVTTIDVEENLGCPGGRNVALARLREYGDVDVVVELDDDGLLVDADVLSRVRDLYAADPRLGIVGFRIADEHGETQQRHVPRVGDSDPMRGGYVTGFLGGGHALSMAMLAETGDWPAEFFFAHEETDLAWRAVDAGWKILYAPELLLQHPKTSPARHAIYYRVNARNRVWLVRQPAARGRSSPCTSGCGRCSRSPAHVRRPGSKPGSAGSWKDSANRRANAAPCAGERCGG